MTDRNTPRRTGMIDYEEAYDMAAGVEIEAGKIVALDASGNAVEYDRSAANTANALTVVGRAEHAADNSGEAAGANKIRVRTGVFRWNNDVSGDELDKSDIGSRVHGEDDETVRKTAVAGNNRRTAPVGLLVQVDSDGAWVATGIPFLQ